jgi:drug/metabolite transporter (DMT)-like permease
MPKWLIYCSASMVIWAIWSLLSPIASQGLSGAMVQILSSAGLLPFALILLFSGNLRKASNLKLGMVLALATGITAGLGNVMLYDALGLEGPISLVFPIVGLAPLIAVLAAPFLFKERIRRTQALGIAMALVAIVLLNINPPAPSSMGSASFFSRWMLYTLMATVIFGIAFIAQKGATYFISDELSTIAYTVGFLVLDFQLFLTDHSLTWKIPTRAGWVSVLIGILMGAGTLTLFAAYRYGRASIVTPFSQLYPVITVLVGAPLYHERIGLLRGLGIAAALTGGLVLSLEKENVPPARTSMV